MKYPRLVIAGTHSGAGKTTVTQGIMLSLLERGYTVQPYKAGPDYIDPGFHTAICGRPSRNLDTMLLQKNSILELFATDSRDADISVIEGVMGYYDGAGGNDERGSTAHLAKILKAPVILVIDVRAMAGSAGALAYGFIRYKKVNHITGFILNNAGSENHYAMTKEAIEKKTGLPVFGYLPKRENLKLPERHLGLVPAWESEPQKKWRNNLASLMNRYVDLNAIIKTAQTASSLPPFSPIVFSGKYAPVPVRIGYALDHAFHFYYADNLDILKHQGAELIPFSPIKDSALPENLDGLYFGGGYPELFADQLEKNRSLKKEIYLSIEQGMPVLAECGGLMYLMEYLRPYNGKVYKMAGIFPGTVEMGKKLYMLGYYEGELTEDTPIGKRGKRIKGHVYHWSRLINFPENACRPFILRKAGKPEHKDGFIKKNTLASYLHIHFATDPSCVNNFIKSCNNFRKKRELNYAT